MRMLENERTWAISASEVGLFFVECQNLFQCTWDLQCLRLILFCLLFVVRYAIACAIFARFLCRRLLFFATRKCTTTIVEYFFQQEQTRTISIVYVSFFSWFFFLVSNENKQFVLCRALYSFHLELKTQSTHRKFLLILGRFSLLFDALTQREAGIFIVCLQLVQRALLLNFSWSAYALFIFVSMIIFRFCLIVSHLECECAVCMPIADNSISSLNRQKKLRCIVIVVSALKHSYSLFIFILDLILLHRIIGREKNNRLRSFRFIFLINLTFRDMISWRWRRQRNQRWFNRFITVSSYSKQH